MKTLIICWKREGNPIEQITVMGVDLDPSGIFWYYIEDPNDRIEVKPSEYFWASVV
jgi:hypothetical protein